DRGFPKNAEREVNKLHGLHLGIAHGLVNREPVFNKDRNTFIQDVVKREISLPCRKLVEHPIFSTSAQNCFTILAKQRPLRLPVCRNEKSTTNSYRTMLSIPAIVVESARHKVAVHQFLQLQAHPTNAF